MKIDIKYCCDKFAEYAQLSGIDSGAFEWDGEGGMGINGCCGGGCYVLSGMKFCPFCGEEIKDE